MIQILISPVPANFEAAVGRPGRAFLASHPSPSNSDWQGNDYWRKAHNDLYRIYGGICAYCASWTPRKRGKGVDHSSVDHYIPKSRDPSKAYDWDNFRLARSKLNGWKGNHLDVVDPVSVRAGWFVLDFATFRVAAGPGLSAAERDGVDATIARLRLNTDSTYLNERARVAVRYAAGVAPLSWVERRYPFIAAEMHRQDFENQFKPTIAGLVRRHPQIYGNFLR